MPGEFLNCSYVDAGCGKPGAKCVTKDVERYAFDSGWLAGPLERFADVCEFPPRIWRGKHAFAQGFINEPAEDGARLASRIERHCAKFAALPFYHVYHIHGQIDVDLMNQ